MGYYKLNEKNEPVQCSEVEYAWVLENTNRQLAITEHNDINGITDIIVSTVFLGLDHNYGGHGAPIVFETMIFGGECNGEMRRYSKYDDAIAGHNDMVKMVIATN